MSVEHPATLPEDLARQVTAGSRLDAAAVRRLATVTDILALGALADDARRARHGATATFVRVQLLDLQDAASWTAAPDTAHEVRITGVPESLDQAVDAVLQARPLAGARVLRGFTVADLVRLGGEESCRALAASGLDEVALCETEPGVADAVRAAREAGLAVRVVGVAQMPADSAAWLLDVRALQDAVGGFDALAPLPRVIDPSTPTTGFADVRQVALARLIADNIASVQVDWSVYGPKLAQVALTVGADDLDAVAAVDDLTQGRRRATLEDLRRNITAAGLTAAERTGRHTRLDG